MTGERLCFCDLVDGCSSVCWVCVEAGDCCYTPPPPPPTPAEIHRARLAAIAARLAS